MTHYPMKTPRPLHEAAHIAAMAYSALEPITRRIVVCGSIRRGSALCGDVEIVAEPMMNGDLFGDDTPILEPIIRAVEMMGEISKQGSRYIQVRDIFNEREFNLDLFLCHPPAQWGSLVAIRTGPWQLGQHCMAELKRHGFKHDRGGIYDSSGKALSVPDEARFFHYAKVPLVPPEERTALAHRLGLIGP